MWFHNDIKIHVHIDIKYKGIISETWANLRLLLLFIYCDKHPKLTIPLILVHKMAGLTAFDSILSN